jgi:hypothetical protein
MSDVAPSDDGALAPERVALRVDDVETPGAQPSTGALDDPIFDLIGSITAPAPEAGDVAVIDDDGGALRQDRVNARGEDLPNDNSFDLQYFESALEPSEPIAVQGDAEGE